MPPKKIVTDGDKIQSKVTCIGKKFKCDYTDVPTCVSDAQSVPATYRVPDFKFFLNQRCGIPEETAESMIKNGKKKDMCEALVSYNNKGSGPTVGPLKISSLPAPSQPPKLPIKTAASVASSRQPPSEAASQRPPSVISDSSIRPPRPPTPIVAPRPPTPLVAPTATLSQVEIKKQRLREMQLEIEEEERREEEQRLADIKMAEEKRLAEIRLAEIRLAEESDDFNTKIKELEQIIENINVDNTRINNKLKLKFKDIFNYLRNKKKKNPSMKLIYPQGSAHPSVPMGSPPTALRPASESPKEVAVLQSSRLSPLGSAHPSVQIGSPLLAEASPTRYQDDDNWVEMLNAEGVPLQVGSTAKPRADTRSTSKIDDSPRSPFSSPVGVNPVETLPMESPPKEAAASQLPPLVAAAQRLSPGVVYPSKQEASPPKEAVSQRLSPAVVYPSKQEASPPRLSPAVVNPSKLEKSPSIKNIENVEELVPDLRIEEDGSEIIEEIIKCLSI